MKRHEKLKGFVSAQTQHETLLICILTEYKYLWCRLITRNGAMATSICSIEVAIFWCLGLQNLQTLLKSQWSKELHFSCISIYVFWIDSSHVQKASVTSSLILMSKEANTNFVSCRQTPHPCLPTLKTGPAFSSKCCLCEGSRSSRLRPHCDCEQSETSSSRSAAPVQVSSPCHRRFSVPGTFDSWVQRTLASSSSHCPFRALGRSTTNLSHFIHTIIICVSYVFDSDQRTKLGSQSILVTQEFCVVRVSNKRFQDSSSIGQNPKKLHKCPCALPHAGIEPLTWIHHETLILKCAKTFF